MSVLGADGRLPHAAAIAQQELGPAAEAALAMWRAEILASEDPFEWIHPLVHRSIYDSLTITGRDGLHARAAEVLAQAGAAPAVIAPHLSALTPAGSTRVVTGLLEAAEDALARGAPDVAVLLLRRALDEQAPDPPRAALLLKLGQVELTRRSPGLPRSSTQRVGWRRTRSSGPSLRSGWARATRSPVSGKPRPGA